MAFAVSFVVLLYLLQSVPIYTSDDVAKHNSKDSGIWVSYKDGVYDITRFVDSHPGGETQLAAFYEL